MNSIPDINSHGLQGRGNHSNARFSGQSSRLSVNSYESLDAGLTIKTREGDIVTLSTSRFSQLTANEYNSRAKIETADTSLAGARHTRQITLASGESFSFSVQGDLNEKELADIESIVAGVDGIIGEMAEGDMDDAIAKAMAMGTYDSVSMYQADISVARSYSAYAQTQSEESGSPAQGPGFGLEDLAGTGPQKPVITSLMDTVTELLKAQEDKALAQAKQPLGQLFAHYLRGQKDASKSDEAGLEPRYKALETAARDIDQLINEMVKDIFKSTLDQMV